MQRRESLVLLYRLGYVYPELVLNHLVVQRSDVPQPFIDCLKMSVGLNPPRRFYKKTDGLVSVKSFLYHGNFMLAKIALFRFFLDFGLAPVSLIGKNGCTIGGKSYWPLKKTKGYLISVIVTTYNSQSFIENCLQGLLSQTWQDLEIIVVDDASSDGTVSLIKNRYPSVKVISLSINKGTYHARNLGIREASGEYITFQDSDDWSHPQRIECQINALKDLKGLSACYSCFFRVNLKTGLPHARQIYPLVRLNLSSLMIKKEDLISVNGFDDSQRVESDKKLFELLKAKGRVDILRLPLAVGSFRSNSLTNDNEYGFNKYGYSSHREFLETV